MELFYTRQNDYKIDLDDYAGNRLLTTFLAKINEDRDVKITKAKLFKMIKDGTVFEEIEQDEWYAWISESLSGREEISNEGDMDDLEIHA
jgi:hypothetical protein